MQFKLEKGKTSHIKIHACEYYSTNYLLVEKGEQYKFKVDPNDLWEDWFINRNADGFFNPFLRNKNKRIYKEKCFKLCGTIGKTEDESHFAIGSNKVWTATQSGNLHFFANDHIDKYYSKNNKGNITLQVERLGT